MHKKLLDRAEQPMIVVDEVGNPTGRVVKRADAHASPGVKHLAFIVFVENGKKEFVLHKRHGSKIGGDTIDSPVSHVLDGETVEQAVHRCLKHEYGISEKLPVKNLGGFSYEKDYGDGTCENEYCLVLVVKYDGEVIPNPTEMVGGIIRMPIAQVIEEVEANPEKYSVWFKPAIELFMGKRLTD